MKTIPYHKKFFVLVSLLAANLILFILLSGLATPARSASSSVYPYWRASQSAVDCTGPSDGGGNLWYETDFDDSAWQIVVPPMGNDIRPGEDRFYRTEFTPPETSSSIWLNIASDDGIWLYVNGVEVYRKGGDCHMPGCVGDIPWWCSLQYGFWVSIDITDQVLWGQPNVIAAHVSNESSASSRSYFSVVISPDALNFELPVYYDYRGDSYRPNFYQSFHTNLEALFDHSTAGDSFFQPYPGQPFTSTTGLSNCLTGVDCFDGSLSTYFTFDTKPADVYPVADGSIIPAKTGCFSIDSYECRVCVSHGSGYSTLYHHLDSDNLKYSGAVTKFTPIGLMCYDADRQISQFGLVAYYDESGAACEPGREFDPSGWASLAGADPHQFATGLQSLPLWMHQTTISTILEPTQAITLPWQTVLTHLKFASGSTTETLRLTMALAPDPDISYKLAGTGHSYYLNAIDPADQPVSQLDLPFQIQIDYDPAALPNIFTDSLKIYQYDDAARDWLPLPGLIDTNTVTAATSKIAPFALLGSWIRNVEVAIEGSGSALVEPAGPYRDGQVITLTATADPDWYFAFWDGAVAGAANPITVTVDGNLAITATFHQDEYFLTLNAMGNGNVVADPGSPYEFGDPLTLTAIADPHWHFTGWSGDLSGSTNPASIVMDANKSITATFELNEYSLTIDTVGEGSVSVDPPGPYVNGDQVTLTATAASHWYFTGWSGDLSGSSNPARLTIDGDETVTATFEQLGTITILLDTDPAGVTLPFEGSFGSFNLIDGQAIQFTDLTAGEYSVTTDWPVDWTLNNAICVGGTFDAIPGGLTIHLRPGEGLSCIFSALQLASLTIVNRANITSSGEFLFDGSLGIFSLAVGEQQTFANLIPGEYDVFETLPVFWSLKGVTCPGIGTTPIAGGVTVYLDPGIHAACTFENEYRHLLYLPVIGQ